MEKPEQCWTQLGFLVMQDPKPVVAACLKQATVRS